MENEREDPSFSTEVSWRSLLMTGKTHIIGGLDVALVAPFFSTAFGMLVADMRLIDCAICLFAAIGGSLFPDIDLHGSKMGHKTGVISLVIQSVFGHRSLFHSPLLMVFLYFCMNSFFPEYQIYANYFFAGMGSHLFLDMCNKKGIPVLYPLPKRFHIASIKTRSFGESLFAIVLLVILFVLLAATLFFPDIFQRK